MTARIKRVVYFNATVKDRPGEAYQLLSRLAAGGVNLLAFNAIPIGPAHTQLVLFPRDDELLAEVARTVDLSLSEAHHAFLIQGDDELGALVEIHRRLYDAAVNIYASAGVTDGRGGFGYVVYVRPDDFENAAGALGV